MTLALGLASLVVAVLGVCIEVTALLIRIDVVDPKRIHFRPLSAPLRAAERVARSQWLQGLVAGLAVAAITASASFLLQAFDTDGIAVRIISPSEGDVVPREISVEIEARLIEQEEFLVVFVRPLPGDPNQDYFLQQFPQPIENGRWDSRPVYVGAPDDQSGTPFNVCAVITRTQFQGGERSRMLPAGPSDCVWVTRE